MKDILKEFDDIYGENHHKICVGKNCECHKEVKQFISNIINQTREETLAVPYNVSEWKRIGQERKYWDYFKQDIREEMIRVAMKRIEQIKSAIAKNTGSYKYDSCYDDCLNVLQSLINLRSK